MCFSFGCMSRDKKYAKDIMICVNRVIIHAIDCKKYSRFEFVNSEKKHLL